MVQINDGILLGHKKWNLTICDSMDEAKEYYVKWNKPVRERQIYDFNYMWTLKNKINKQNRKRLIDVENRLMVAKEEGGWGTGWKR